MLLAARLTGWKGQKVLVEAAARLRDGGLSDVAFVLAGDPQGRDGYVKELDALIAARSLKGVVRRVGHCTDMPAAFLAASVVTVPSTEPEAFGRSAVEAQAMGTPVVVSDLGAVPETVLSPPDVTPQERTGWRIPPGDAGRAGQGHRRSAGIRGQRPRRPWRPGRAHVESNFSLERMVGSTLDVYSSLLEGRFARRNELTSGAFGRNVETIRGIGASIQPRAREALRNHPVRINRRFEPFADQ